MTEERPTSPALKVDVSVLRRAYGDTGISEDEVAPDPFEQFSAWLHDVVREGLPEPNAMLLATATPDGVPSSRLVLLKGFDERGFVFYTNYGSRKGRDLAANPRASLTFPWYWLQRQVRVDGPVERLAAEETAAYFRSRPHDSQLGAWASRQSTVLPDRATLESRYAELAARWPEGTEVPVPDFWGGFRVVPLEIEFWAGRASRLHDRVVYRRTAPGQPWALARLAP